VLDSLPLGSMNTRCQSLARAEQLTPYIPGDLGDVGNMMDALAICGGYAEMSRLGAGAMRGAFDSSTGIRNAASRTGNAEHACARSDQDLSPEVELFMR
jgi:hypothetical protein